MGRTVANASLAGLIVAARALSTAALGAGAVHRLAARASNAFADGTWTVTGPLAGRVSPPRRG